MEKKALGSHQAFYVLPPSLLEPAWLLVLSLESVILVPKNFQYRQKVRYDKDNFNNSKLTCTEKHET